MITITETSIYTVNGEMAYQITYSDGTQVRAVVGGDMIRQEYKTNGEWLLVGKPYIIKHDSRRNAERIKATVQQAH